MQQSPENCAMVTDANRLPPAPEEEITNTATSVRAMEELFKYRFKNTKLLEEALTHSSNNYYQRLAFVRDAALCLVISSCLFVTYPDVDCGKLTDLRAVNKLLKLPSGTASTSTSAAIRQSSMKRVGKEIGPAHGGRFICSVQIAIAEGMLFGMGDEKSRVKDAENSAALTMIRSCRNPSSVDLYIVPRSNSRTKQIARDVQLGSKAYSGSLSISAIIIFGCCKVNI
ncbi:uncharacterized protein LOC129877366 [Solanum dulcamara]|uniref:uncharacterized protein LOC129877366 n=1 Tax=Solanum dulcamara TaxID=45834 RepID=UPI002485C3B1|nr:uncharacterized protein LOC129877366 [Solanum dulcamara]